MDGPRAAIPGSAPEHDGSTPPSTVKADLKLTASLVLRRRPEAADLSDQLLSGHFQPLSREQALEQVSADPRDVAAVGAFARESGLQVLEADAAKRVVKVSGPVAAFDRAFGVQIGKFGNFISYQGSITVPEALAGIIVAVLGLDGRPVARQRALASDQ